MYQQIGTLISNDNRLPAALADQAKEKKYHGHRLLALKEVPAGSEILGTLTANELKEEDLQRQEEAGQCVAYSKDWLEVNPAHAVSIRYFVPFLADSDDTIKYLIVPKHNLVPLLIVILSLSLVLSLACSIIAWRFWSQNNKLDFPTRAGISSAMEPVDVEQKRQELQEQVVHMTVSMSCNPTRQANGTYNAMISNVPENQYNLCVQVVDEAGEELYRSPLLQPGEALEYICLQKQLPTGSDVRATAYYFAYAPDGDKLDGRYVGCTYVDNLHFYS